MTDNRTTEQTTTERLRALLDERGVEHYDGTESTLWLKDEHGYRASADELSSGRLSVHIWCDTPEQAIAATLGSEREKALEELVCEMWREITTCPDYRMSPCMTKSICESVRKLEIEVN